MSGWEWQEAVFQWVSLKVAEWEARHWTVASQIRPILLAGVAEQDTGPQRRSARLEQTAATSLLSSFPPHCHSPVNRCCRPNGAGACASSSGSSECFVARCASSQRRGNPSSESMSESAIIRRAAHPQNTPRTNQTRLRRINSNLPPCAITSQERLMNQPAYFLLGAIGGRECHSAGLLSGAAELMRLSLISSASCSCFPLPNARIKWRRSFCTQLTYLNSVGLERVLIRQGFILNVANVCAGFCLGLKSCKGILPAKD